MNSEIKADPGTPVAAPAKTAEESALHPPKSSASGTDRPQGRGGNQNSNRGGQRGGRGSPGGQPRGNIRGGRGGNFRGGNFRGGRGGGGAAGGGGNARDGLGGGDFEGMGFGRGGGNFVRGRGGGGMGGNRYVDKVTEKLKAFEGQPTIDLPPLDMSEKKYNGRARLYVGNFSTDTTEEQIKELVCQYGEVGEVFFNREKMFAFLRMATRTEAEKAKRGLDGQMKNGRPLKVRFAPHQGALKVSNLGPWVSNELLHKAFSIFGDIERCIVHVDERGKPKGDGFVEFDRKPCALEALKRCSNGCFFLTSSLRPVVAELVEDAEDEDGLQEKMIPKRNNDYHTERETGPRFAAPGSFEYEYGNKWKALYELKKQKVEALEREMKLEEDKLVAQMEFARYEHETEHLRDQLRQREANRESQKTRFEMKERQMEDMMKQEQERRQREEEDMLNRMQQQESSMRQKQQDNSLFMQAQELSEMLDQQEAAIGTDNMGFRGGRGGGFFGGPGRGGFGEGGFGSFGGFGEGFGGGRWNNDEGPGGKRRRF